ncbi:DNA-binding protein RFX7 [Nothobranchius furzeri]|uniref:DNA-binding protein RFX7-like n=3 Tax=Nothobranchius furzeri TaxID=105023 RepID=A0A8C6LF82_NOTFU|nr:DNA-binding protein RFX7-like [Nothobranchius furzeri]
MADEEPQQPEPGAGGLPGLLPGLQGAEVSTLQLRIKNSICKSVQSKVENILQDVEKFSDIEKLYLYLKLPSGPSSSADKSDQNALSSSRTQQMHAFSWIREHLEEYPETSLPKQEVYDEYKSFCDNLNYHPLSAADFGKMMKNVFPNMKARRLGMRGKSKYCYSGLRKRPYIHMPSLPTLDLHKTPDGLHCDALESPCQLSSIKEEVRFAACDLVCEWAQKVLKRQFDSVEDLAHFLIDSHYISNKSLAALTIMTGTATESKPSQTVSAFLPTSEARPFQPQVTMFSSPSVDAKQQLQRKIQRKQQEQKLQSPSPADGHAKRVEDVVASSPTTPSPQPTFGIVAAVPSPITVQKSRQLMSPSPVGALESKVLPINFQMLPQPVQAVKQSPKPAQNNLISPVGERTARQRYAQILPKPSATSAVALHSPSTMIITNSPIKTVMTTCHISPVSLVKMATISLAPNSRETTSLTTTTLRPASAGITSAAAGSAGANQSMRSTSAMPILAPVAELGMITDTQSMDVEMEVEAIHRNSQMQRSGGQVFIQKAMVSRGVGAVQRAASVPIPQTKDFLISEEMSSSRCSGKPSSDTNTVADCSNNSFNKSTVHLTSPTQSTSTVNFNTSRLPSFDGVHTEEGFVPMKSLRKRSGLSPNFSPVKRIFIPHQPAEGALASEYINTTEYVSCSGATGRPESAPVTQEVEMRMSSASCTSSVRASGFDSVAKTHSSLHRDNTSTIMETGPSLSDAILQERQELTVGNMHGVSTNTGFQKHAGVSSNSTTGCLDGALQQMYAQPDPANDTLQFFNQASSAQLPVQEPMDYFSFDDDVTQDSIVEELVQMEEQMKLKRLQELGNCGPLQGQHTLMPSNAPSTSQATTAFYHTANNNSRLIQTPTPTSEMMGGVQSLTGESPCSYMASTTPVDSALGSSHHTPVGTPHSNCSSNIPPSPVECRNPFAFTPINSNMTCFHDNSTISSSPVKPMQRPTATHPDKARLEWMSNSYSSGSGSTNKSSGVGILTGYRGLIDEHFQKPHAFAVPHARHHDHHCGRLTPISPVQQQVSNIAKQEGFAVPAPLDNKTPIISAANFRCRSVSPAVHQRNPPSVPRSVASPFNSPVTPEVLNIFSNCKANLAASSMAQRSRSVPLNVMMQTQVPPTPNQQCSNKNITSVLLSKMEGENCDGMRGLGLHNLSSTYMARMNLTQILESKSSHSCTEDQVRLMTDDTSSSCTSQRPKYLVENTINQQQQSLMLAMSSLQQQEELQRQQQMDFSSVHHLIADNSLATGSQLSDQVSELTTGGADFPCEIRMTSELSSSINDLNALDTNLLFDPNQQQSKYENAAAEELFQPPHSAGLEWLESKDHPAVGLMG